MTSNKNETNKKEREDKMKNVWVVQDYDELTIKLFTSKTKAMEYIKKVYPQTRLANDGYIFNQDDKTGYEKPYAIFYAQGVL